MSYFTSTIFLPSSATSVLSPDKAIPLQLKANTDSHLNLKQSVVRYQDGYSLNRANLFENTKDVKINKHSLLKLTQATIQEDFIEENDKLFTSQDYIDKYGFAYTYIGTEFSPTKFWTIDSDTKKLILTDDEDLVDIFKITKIDNKYVISTILDGREKFFSIDITQYNTIFLPELVNEPQFIQKFDISFNNNIVTISFPDVLSSKTIGLKDNEIGVRVASVHSNRYDFNILEKEKPQQFRLFYENLTSFERNTLLHKNQSWIHYFNELEDKQNDKNVNIHKDKSIDNVPINYLVVTPYEAKVEDSKINIDLVPLKNMMTPEGNYALKPFSSDDGSVLPELQRELQPKRREYQKIYGGEESSTDYSRILTSFSSNTQLMELPAGETTYFHYPFEAKQLPLSASGLIEAGALPGATPATSDKIFKKNAKYENFKYWGKSQQIFGCDDGVWLCAWLSGSNGSSIEGLNNGVWVDRWYNPSLIAIDNALQQGFTSFSFTPNEPVFFDVPSELTLDPGVWYKYQRLGTEDLQFIVDTFDTNKELLLHYKDEWGELVEDKSTYNNTGNIPRFNNNQIRQEGPAENELEQFSISLDGNRFIQVPHSQELDLSGSFTISTWVKSNNWEQNTGSALINTNFRSGASINYTNHFYNPIVSVVEKQYAHVLQYSQCSPISDARISSTISLSTDFADIVSQITIDDLFTYALDNYNKTLVKIEYSGEVVFLKTFDETCEFNETSLQLNEDENILLHDINNNDLYIINPINLEEINITSISDNKIILDNFGNVISGDWLDAVVDNENRIYTIEHSTNPDDYNETGFDASGASFDGATGTIDQIISTGFTRILCRYQGPEEKTTDDYVLLSTLDREVVTFTDEFYQEVQFENLYPNSGSNGILSKPFNPNQLLFTRDDYLYIFNDTRELIILEVNRTKPLRLVKNTPLFAFEKISGKNLIDLEIYGNTYQDFINTPLWPSISANNSSQISPGVTWEFDEPTQTFQNRLWLVEEKSRAMYKTNKDFIILECFSLPDAVDKLAYPGENSSLYAFTLKPSTTYDWHRKFSWLKNNREEFGLYATAYTQDENENVTKHRLRYNGPSLVNKNWYHASLTYNQNTGSLEFYVDNVLTDSLSVTPGSSIYNIYSNGVLIGNPLLRSNALNTELNCNMYAFDGLLYDIRMYNTYLTQNQQAQIILSSLKIQNIEWNIPIGARQYIEQIERFFKHQTPGNHSQYFNIRLSGLKIYDVNIRKDIEEIIKKTISKSAPSYVSLLRIEWDD